MRRLVLYLSASYGAQWMDTLESPDVDVTRQRLVLTSVGPFEISHLARSLRAVADALVDSRDEATISMGGFVEKIRAVDPSIRFSAVPEDVMDEALVNPVSPTSDD